MPSPNDKCPCGSGKKYKRCCMGEDLAARDRLLDEAASPLDDEPWRSEDDDAAWPAEHRADDGHEHEWEIVAPPSPYLRLLAQELPEALQQLSLEGLHQRTRTRPWTVARVSDMPTQAIVEQLREMGVGCTRERFLELAEGRTSAWSISEEVWLGDEGPDCAKDIGESFDEDFLGLAACELWRRWRPERPSNEMLATSVLEGYTLATGAGALKAGCESWLAVFKGLNARILAHSLGPEDMDQVFRDHRGFGAWIASFTGAVREAALAGMPGWAEVGLELLDLVHGDLVGTAKREDATYAQLRADFLLAQGELAAAGAEYRSLPERWPADGAGHLALAAFLADEVKPGTTTPDRPAALEVLRRALEAAGIEERHREAARKRIERLQQAE